MKELFVGAAVLLAASSAFASITPSLVSSPVFNAGTNDFTYNYSIVIASDQTATKGSAAPAGNTPVGGSSGIISDYFTIYDFSGLVAGSNTQPTGWAFTTATTGATPSDRVGAVADTGTANLTWYVMGGPFAGSNTPITGFSARSTVGTSQPLSFASQGTRNGIEVSNGGTVGPSDVPEPGTYALLGGGLIAFGLLRRRSYPRERVR